VVAKFLCRCGAQIRTSGGIPHDTELLMIADREIGDETWEGPLDMGEVYARMTHVFPCSDCGRLWIFWQGFDAEPVSYMPEVG
jgi:hypothetical protein